jgi:hypothetical protein
MADTGEDREIKGAHRREGSGGRRGVKETVAKVNGREKPGVGQTPSYHQEGNRANGPIANWFNVDSPLAGNMT